MTPRKQTTTLVVGATGATGSHVVKQLLEHNHKVRVIVRAPQKFAPDVRNHPNLSIIKASVLNLGDNELLHHVKDSDAVVSCLGHSMNLKGIYGHPRKLCTDTIKRLAQAIEHSKPTKPTRLILMSTVAVNNPDLAETRPLGERILLTILRGILPPQTDNEQAATSLHNIGTNNRYIEWCAVRPSGLTNEEIEPFGILASSRKGLFSDASIARASVAQFMVQLIEGQAFWAEWKFRMPVVVNKSAE